MHIKIHILDITKSAPITKHFAKEAGLECKDNAVQGRGLESPVLSVICRIARDLIQELNKT